MARVKMIQHINVPISDRARTREWYERVLGAASSHFALEVHDWKSMIAHLDTLGIAHVRTSAASVARNLGGTDPHQGRREDTGEHYTYIHDPDGNMIELVYHPLGLEDSEDGVRRTQHPGFVEAAYGERQS